MTVSELIKWLQTQDQGATVRVVERVPSLGYQGDTFKWADFDPVEHSDYADMRGNRFAKGKPYENDRMLYLGSN